MYAAGNIVKIDRRRAKRYVFQRSLIVASAIAEAKRCRERTRILERQI